MCTHTVICMSTPWAPVPWVASASMGSYGSDCASSLWFSRLLQILRLVILNLLNVITLLPSRITWMCRHTAICMSTQQELCWKKMFVLYHDWRAHRGQVRTFIFSNSHLALYHKRKTQCWNVPAVAPLSSACDVPSCAYFGGQAQQSHSKKTCDKKQMFVLYSEWQAKRIQVCTFIFRISHLFVYDERHVQRDH